MKKTSIVFLVVSVLLIITGFVMKNKALEQADEKNINLFRQEITDKKDLVETIEFSIEDTNKININLKDTKINVIGNAEKNYVEIINFNTLEYSAYPNNRSFNIENDIVSSLSGRAESGNISFNGVRDFVRFNKHNKDKIINIYLAANSQVKIFDIKLEEGDISFTNMNQTCDYNVILKKGNIKLAGTQNVSLADFDVKKGNIKLENAFIANANIKVENGNLDFSSFSNIVYDYEIESETGEIKVNGETHEGKYTLENDEVNGIFTAHIGVGNVNITTTTPPVTAE
jgi:hypothetical protein